MSSSAEKRRLVAADFDGTIRSRDAGITAQDLETLRALGEAGILRVIATGRSPFSFYSAIERGFPADYLVFSSGAGILEIETGRVLRHLSFRREQALRLIELLQERDADFMLHLGVPINHHFYYRPSSHPAPDFLRRLELYRSYARLLPEDWETRWSEGGPNREIMQFVAIFPPQSHAAGEVEALAAEQAGVIRATSPLDGESRWVELFPPGTDKGSALAWLAESLSISPADCLGVGNDYNDLHMLQWCGSSFVVANAPGELRRRYRTVASCREAGFSEAVRRWKESRT
jgi:hypothetical protein